VRLHRWGLGFRQCSFHPITRVLRDDTFSVFRWPPLFRHALFPSSFRLQVNRMTQERSSGLLLTESRIQHRVPRRTLSPHPAFQVTTTLLRGSRPDILVSQGRTRGPRSMVPDISAFPCVVCWPLFGSNGGHSIHHTSRHVIVVTLADLRLVYPITGYHLVTTPPPSSTTSAGIFASAIRVGTQVQRRPCGFPKFRSKRRKDL
jgi:hypothetical protein